MIIRPTANGRAIKLAAALFSLGIAATVQAQEGDPRRGLDYAKRICAECHAVLPSEPSARIDAPAFKVIANTPGMTGTALAVWLQTPHNSMLDLIIDTEDRNKVIAYIVSLRDPPAR